MVAFWCACTPVGPEITPKTINFIRQDVLNRQKVLSQHADSLIRSLIHIALLATDPCEVSSLAARVSQPLNGGFPGKNSQLAITLANAEDAH